ncbi:MAG: 2Fe-2S iron-sulfur cluster-binding protein [Enterocloster bolteae]
MGENFCFTVNGVERCTSEDKPLLRYLRDDLHLHSVKDGCSEGACGTCTIVVDGKAVKSCVLTTRRAVGKNIITTEGLSDAEKEAFVYAFGAMGSVQCGFCTPGMVMAGKALIDRVPDPTEEEIKVALKGNICRCTGYKKIHRRHPADRRAISEGRRPDMRSHWKRAMCLSVGRRAFPPGCAGKRCWATASTRDDVEMEGMVYAFGCPLPVSAGKGSGY